MSIETWTQKNEEKIKKLQENFSSNYPIRYVVERNIIGYDYGGFCKGELKCHILIEMDRKNPAFKIYYGIKVEVEEQESEPCIDSKWKNTITEISKLFAIHWKSHETMQNRLLIGCWKIEPDGEKFVYWPFWIEVEADEKIECAHVGASLIVSSLIAQGFKQL